MTGSIKNITAFSREQKIHLEQTDYEVGNIHETIAPESVWYNLKYLLAGTWFGILLIKSEVISWFRIQEMFRLQSFHMYGILGSAVITGIISVWLIKKFNIRTIHGKPVDLPVKKFHRGQVVGGLVFGFGWALTGACPGPLFAQIGAGNTVIIITLLSAIAGTWIYGLVREYLPH
ncbi:MAG TPA: DUF6691 family protein [Flavitalea sp.]|nr:DUF6691 family protein [Flavitalea sp.]